MTEETGMSAERARAVAGRARCLFTREQIGVALDKIAAGIDRDLATRNPVLLCVVTGGILTTSELAQRLAFPMEIDYVHASRYGDEISGGELEWHHRPQTELSGRAVLLVDDIFDQGATLAGIVDYCKQQGAASVHVAVLVDKIHDRKLTSLRPDYIGLTVDDVYIYGFGMDYRGYLRNQDGIYAIADEDY